MEDTLPGEEGIKVFKLLSHRGGSSYGKEEGFSREGGLRRDLVK